MSDETTQMPENTPENKKNTKNKVSKKIIIITASIGAAVIAVAAAVVFVVLPLTKNSVKADEFGWYHNYDAAKKLARQENKSILLLVSETGEDKDSRTLKDTILNTKEFTAAARKNFVLVNIDVTQAAYQKTVAAQNATEKEQKTADDNAAEFKRNMQILSLYRTQMTPAVYVSTKDGYFVSYIVYDASVATPAAYLKVLADKTEDIKKVNALAAATEKNSGIEKVKAIDALYEATDQNYRDFLVDIYREIPDLDKKNESGLVSKYVLATANSDAIELYSKGDYPGAAKIFADAATGGKLNKDDTQQSYYTAGYLLGSVGSQDYTTIIAYLQAAYDADPESEHASSIQQTIDYVKNMETAADNAKTGDSSAKTK
ncbi:MAG: thioredoxin family protein [Treponema sp.]